MTTSTKVHPHGYKESNPKIDLYVDGVYKASTNWSVTNKQAIKEYSVCHGIDIARIKARRA